MVKIGIGFDIHKLISGRKLILGGVDIPYEKGLAGHSDADVVLHAVCDAMLGALGKPDIGCYFPDTDKRTVGMSSLEIVKKVMSVMTESNWEIGNVDIAIICEQPCLSPHYQTIRDSLASLLCTEKQNVGLKAKTLEGIGDIGKGNAIACFSSVLLVREEKNPQ